MMLTSGITVRTWGLLALLLVSLVWLVDNRSSGRSSRPGKPGPPSLFEGFGGCSPGERSIARADESFRYGHHRAARYPYDPGDGIRAVRHLRHAEDCYRSFGLDSQADDARRLASVLRARIDADYASSRLLLDEALALSNWDAASREIFRLLALTKHLSGDAYVEWLRGISGKVTTRANKSE